MDVEIKKNIKPFNSIFLLLIAFPLIILVLVFIIFLAPFLLIGFIFYSYFNYKKEILIIKQKHQRALKNNFNF